MSQQTKTIFLFIMTAVAYVTIGKAPGLPPMRNRDLEASILSSIVLKDRDV